MGLAHVFKQALCKPDGCGGERDGMGTQFSLGSDFFGYCERALKELVQIGAEGLGLLGAAGSVFHLTQNLGFAQHHRVEPAGYPKRVSHRTLAGQGIEVFIEFACSDPPMVGDPVLNRRLRLIRAVGRGVDFGPVAGRQDGALRDQSGVLAAQVAQRVAQMVNGKRDPFAQGDWSGHVIQSERE